MKSPSLPAALGYAWFFFLISAPYAQQESKDVTDSAKSALAVCAVGDVHLGSDYPNADSLPSNRADNLLSPVKQYLQGDLVFGNLEGPLLDGGETEKCASSDTCFAFRTPTELGVHLEKAGFNVLSLANNHAMDFGETGRQSTLDTLDALGILHTGPPGDIAEFSIGGKSIAVVAFAPYDHSHNLLHTEQAAQTVANLKKIHDLVIVSFHGGTEGAHALRVEDQPEYLGKEPRGNLVAFTHAMVDAGADLALGHGPHVLRGMELYRQRLIAYSLGNFCTYGRFNLSGPLGISVVLQAEIDLETGHFLRGWLRPVRQIEPGGPIPDPQKKGIKMIRELSAKDFPYSAPHITAIGEIKPSSDEGAGFFTLNQPDQRKKLRAILDAFSKQGIHPEKLRSWFGDSRANLVSEVIEKMQKPAEHLAYEQYRKLFITPQVITTGLEFYEQNETLLHRIEKRYKVDKWVLLGLVGVETKFGSHKGTYPAFNALTTLALGHPRRSGWAQKELKALVEQFSTDPLTIMGSYAGAVGLVQFMPTSIRAYGIDHDKDGLIDLDSWQDALASAANYLKKHGWSLNQPIQKKTSNYRAVFRYNPDHNYVKVVKELSELLADRIKAKQAKPEPAQIGAKEPLEQQEK